MPDRLCRTGSRLPNTYSGCPEQPDGCRRSSSSGTAGVDLPSHVPQEELLSTDQESTAGTGRVHVLVDATAVPADRGGVGRYLDELLAALDARWAELRLTVVCQRHDAQTVRELAPHAAVVAAPRWIRSPAPRLLWEQLGLPVLARRTGAQLIHSPHYTMPLAGRLPVLVTLHDATFFSDRSLHSGLKARFFRSWIRISGRRAARCVVPSRATADELMRWAGVPAARLQVAHHGVDHERFRPPSATEVTAARERLALGDRPFVAFLGTLEPRKNVPALIRAFVAVVTAGNGAAPADAPALVLAGGDGWDTGVAPALAAVPDGVTVIKAGYLPLALLPALLGGAELVAYPALGEGFGLPVLEAMACGAPVLTTRLLALPEVGGDAVAYTEPDESSLRTALADLLADPDRRAELSAAGVLRAAAFTWAACADLHLQAYRSAIGVRR